jgi:glutamyl-tRNA synthetase
MRIRVAPAPTAAVHVGAARVALVAWLLARREGGHALLRLDDADPARGRPGWDAAAEQDLAWFGLAFNATVRQSERLERYALAADRLRAAGRLYPCLESEEELTAKRDRRLRRGQSPAYDRAMLALTPKQLADAQAGGKTPYWRFRLSDAPAVWSDGLLGRCEVKRGPISDPILVRADGVPMPALASAVDDIELGITHIVRSAEHMEGTAVQLDLMAALGARTPPALAHLPPLVAPQGISAGKAGLPTLRSLRSDGVEPAAIAGMLAGLGVERPPRAAMPAELAEGFALEDVGTAPPRFDIPALLALNRRALRGLPFDAVRDRLPPAATPAFWMAVRGGLDLLREARGWWDVVAGSIVPPLLAEDADFLQQALAALPPEPWDGETWGRWVAGLREATGRRGKALLMPLRLALTGEDHGPELSELLPLMGRPRVAERLLLATA